MKAVIFDLFLTLITSGDTNDISKVVNKDLGWESTEDYYSFSRIPDEEELAEAVIKEYHLNPDLKEKITEFHREIAQCTTIPGAIETVKWAKDQGLKVALISNYVEYFNKFLPEDFQKECWDLFDFKALSTELQLRKPDPKIFEITLEKLGVKPEEVIMIGDSLNSDIRGAKAVGIKGIWINSEGKSSDEAIACVKSIKEVKEKIKQFL